MGKLLNFGKNNKLYKLPVGKAGKEGKVRSSRADAVKEQIAAEVSGLRSQFTDSQVNEIQRELEAEALAELPDPEDGKK